ncbi:hypothetical protein MOQ_005331 [Trypanosoma cruzi marinkellei]|uniref:Uncharacterized protein n=1 Tax=Trypanosoma cruzi marinkellei TaxID=85056 RepID=K2NPQ0_TRYCR|nr:hypothetical protein MOQ_005331 [Trypanosoma cruzi marinkellei]
MHQENEPLKSNLLSSSNAKNDPNIGSSDAVGIMPTREIKNFFAIDTDSEGSGSRHMDIKESSEPRPKRLGISHSHGFLPVSVKKFAIPSSSDSFSSLRVSPNRADDVHLDDTENAEGEKRRPSVGDQSNTSCLVSGDDAEETPSRHEFQTSLVIPREGTFMNHDGNRQVLESRKSQPMAEDIPVGNLAHRSPRSHQQRKDCLVELYYRGVKTRKQLEEKLESIRAARENEFKAYSFQPKITNRAKAISRSGSFPGCYERDTRLRQRLLLEAWRSESEGQCQSTPKISKGSERIVRRVRGNSAPVIPVEERLHLDAARRRCRMAEDEEGVKQQISSVKRTAGDIKIHIDRLYMYEEKRQLALRKLREETGVGRSQMPLYVSSEDVVRRLSNPLKKSRRDHSVEENLRFAPQLSPVTEELSLRSRRRRIDDWYLFFTHRHGEGVFPPNAVAEKIREALQQADLLGSFSRRAFGMALDAYEKRNGLQLWHSTPPPSAPPLNEELTFVPRINSQRNLQAHTQMAHERLFSAAKQQQLAVKEEERMRQKELLEEEEKRRRRQQRQQQQFRALSREKMKSLEGIGSAGDEKRSPPSSLVQSKNSQGIADPSCDSETSVVSSESVISSLSDPSSMSVAIKSASSLPNLLAAAEQLRQLIDSPAETERNNTKPLFFQRDAVLCADNNNKPACVPADTSELIVTPSEPTVLRVQKKKNHNFTSTCVSTDLLLECALSRLVWPADVATRRREWCKCRRRLQRVGKMLYQNM